MKYGNGTIDIQRNGKARARIPNGKGGYRTVGTFETKEDAMRMLAAVHDERGKMPDGATTLAEYGRTVIMRFKLAGKASWDDDLSRWNNIVCRLADWAQFPPDAVTPGEIKDFCVDLLGIDSERGTPYSAQSVKHVLNLVRGVFAAALDRRLVDSNPAVGIKPPKGVGAADNWTALTLAEIARVARCNTRTRLRGDNIPVPWPDDKERLSYEQCVVFLFVVYTGLRQGECAALRWTDVLELDTLGGQPHLWIQRSWNTNTTKSRKPRRVDLIPAAAQLLRAWKRHMRSNVSLSVWGHLYAHGYDWGWAGTTDLKHNGTNGVCWLGAKRQAGISRRVTFHHLRDTCASHLLTGSWGFKWTIAEVAALLGHSTTYVTERYARILPGALAEIAAQTYRAAAKPAADLPQRKAPSSTKTTRFIGRAMQDSNLRHPAPEAEDSPMISSAYADGGRFAAGVADEFLRTIGAGKAPSKKTLEQLAHAVLGQSILSGAQATLAARVLGGGRYTLASAIELAGLLREVEPDFGVDLITVTKPRRT